MGVLIDLCLFIGCDSILHLSDSFSWDSSNSLYCSYALLSNLGASLEDFHRYDSIRDLVPIRRKAYKGTPVFGRLGHGDWIRALMFLVSLCVMLSSQRFTIHILWHFLSFPTVFELDDKQLADRGSPANANTNGRLKGHLITLRICQNQFGLRIVCFEWPPACPIPF